MHKWLNHSFLSGSQQRSKRLRVILALGLFAIGGAAGRVYQDTARANVLAPGRDAILGNPVLQPGADFPDPVVAGNPDDAVERARRLIVALREANWNSLEVPWEMRVLPDHIYAENKSLRSNRSVSYTEMEIPAMKRAPEYDEVAFFTDIYVRQNTSYYRGDKARSNPTGFYIVGWKNGDVTKVPVGDVRVMRSVEPDKVVWAFPGMRCYDPSKPRLPFVEFANRDASGPALAAYDKETLMDDTLPCRK